MSERYSKLFSLQENLYIESSPVIVAAGALLKDNQSGKVLVQLKLRSISDKAIKAVTVSIAPFDTMGKPLGDPLSHQYLDLTAQRNDDFAQKSPVILPDTSTRSFSVTVEEVIFADNSVWSGSGKAWEAIEAPKALDELGDKELVKQFKLKYGAKSKNMLSEQKDIWFCTCGSVNHADEAECHCCGNKLDELRKLDIAELENAKAERLEREGAIKTAKAAKVKKISIIGVVVAALVLLITAVIIPAIRQNEFENWDDATQIESLACHADSTIALKSDGTVIARGRDGRGECEGVDEWTNIISVACSSTYGYTVGLRGDGTVVATGNNYNGQCNVEGWSDVIDVSCGGGDHTVGLQSDGTVLATGDNDYGQCDVKRWKNIVAISCGYSHTVGLKSDGTVVATGNNHDGQCDVERWKNVVAISCGDYHTVGLKSNGKVVATGDNDYGQCDVDDWTDIVAIYCGDNLTIGLTSSGKVVAAGDNTSGRARVGDWSDIVAVSFGYYHTVGLRSDGTVVATGANKFGQCDVDDWTDIVAVYCGARYTAGLKSDGTVVFTGKNYLVND